MPADPDGFVPIVGMKDIQNGRVQIDPNVCVSLSDEDAREYLLADGDILINRTNSPDLVGKAGIFRGSGKAVFASYLVRLELDRDRADPDFVIQILAGEHGQRRIKQLATRAISQANLNPTTFKNHFHIPLPSLTEQIGIREMLLTWDAAIEKTERLIALHLHRKSWLLSKVILATGSEVRLSKVLIPVSRAVSKPLEPYWALGIRSHGKGTFQRFIEDPFTVEMKEVYEVKRNDLIVNITFAWEGAIAFVQPGDEHCLVSHRFPTYEIAKTVAEADFVKYAVNHKLFFTKLGLISPGGAGRNRVLSKKDFLKLSIRLPSLDNQRKSAAVLDTAEREIALLREQMAALKQQKRGLMQKLLTGRWRLRGTEAEAA